MIPFDFQQPKKHQISYNTSQSVMYHIIRLTKSPAKCKLRTFNNTRKNNSTQEHSFKPHAHTAKQKPYRNKKSDIQQHFNQVRWIVHPIPNIRIVPKRNQFLASFTTAASANHRRAKNQEIILRQQRAQQKLLNPSPFHH